MKIAVVGAGAMGAIFGARFAQAGHDTVLVDVAAPLVEKLNADGVTVVRGEEETTTRIPATTDPATVGPVDVVVFFVEVLPHRLGGRARAAARRARTPSSPRSRTAGATATCSRPRTRPSRSSVGVTYNSGTVLELGKVVAPGRRPDDDGPVRVRRRPTGAERLAEALSRPPAWRRTRRVASAPRDLEEADPQRGHACRPPRCTGIARRGAHRSTRRCTSSSPRRRARRSRSPRRSATTSTPRSASRYIHGLLERAGPSKASMLQDFEAGRRTEIDVINGAVVRAADETGVAVPLNRAFVALVKGWESTRGLGMSTRLTYLGAAGYEIVGPHASHRDRPLPLGQPARPGLAGRARDART